ncbi:radical SAM protein [Candidatus Pacearchaeota archaeon]|nr:radical SAM protein [Candidatus Pacearchaeota archaeon]
MRLQKKLSVSCDVAKALVFRKKIPIVVGWNITYKCNLKCQYCGYPSRKVNELDTENVISLIDEMASSGTKILIMSGGEPLLRKDLGQIIEYLRTKDIYVIIYSNGLLVEENIEHINGADEIQISLDGPQDINDLIRGNGVYDKVLRAIEICKNENIKTNISTVICRENVGHLPDILDIAKKYNVGVSFQPVGRRFSGDSNSYEDFPSRIAPSEYEYRGAISYLINEKRKGNVLINNSLSGLRHFSRYLRNREIRCVANLISCVIEPDGKIFTCEMFPDYQNHLIPGNGNFKKSFESLSFSGSCKGYCNGPMLELNLINNFRFNAMVGMWKRFKSGYPN